MPAINVFVISWVGQHENAVHIARQIKRVTDDVRIVYSDPDPSLVLDAPCETIQRPNHLYWGDKFQTCIEATGDNPMLVIHADCTFDDWGDLARRCASVVNNNSVIGVWAPEIDFVQWPLDGVIIANLDDGVLRATSRTDAIVFYLAAPIVARMRLADYSRNIFGRGIEMMMVAASYARGLIAVIDTALTVTHPADPSGYDENVAHIQLNEFVEQMDLREKIQHHMLKAVAISKGVVFQMRKIDHGDVSARPDEVST